MGKDEPNGRTEQETLVHPDKIKREKRRLFKEVREDTKYRTRVKPHKNKNKRRKQNVTKEYLDGRLEE